MAKIIILNTSGNVGKSTITREVFYANLEEYNIFEVEPQNSSHSRYSLDIGVLDSTKKLSIQLMRNSNLVLDVGNTEAFGTLEDLNNLDFLNRFDKFVIPFTMDDKVWEDTSLLIQSLKEDYRIDSNKIYLVLNLFDKKTPNEKFARFTESAKKLEVNFDVNLGIWNSDIITLCSTRKTNIDTLIEDVNYEELIKNTDDEDEQERLFDLMMMQKPLRDFKKHLIDVKNYILG